MKLLRSACLAGLLMPVAALGQVRNGDFEAGAAAWEWRSGKSRTHTGCPLEFQGEFLIEELGRGKVAWFWADQSYEPGTTYFCRRIEQEVLIPAGTRLVYEAKLGERTYKSPDVNWSWSDVTLDVIADAGVDLVAGDRLSGRTKDQSCDTFNTCPSFSSRTLDVSKCGVSRPS